jgi:hypothetical protein
MHDRSFSTRAAGADGKLAAAITAARTAAQQF